MTANTPTRTMSASARTLARRSVLVLMLAGAITSAGVAQRGGGSRPAARAMASRPQRSAPERPAQPQAQPRAFAPSTAPAYGNQSAERAPVYRNGQQNFQQPRVQPAPNGGGVPQMGYGNHMGTGVNNGPVIRRGSAAPATNTPGHLGQWMQQHQGQSTQDQQRALEREPGYNRLPSDQQQRLQQRLQQLNTMPQQQRQRTLNYVEGMEKLTPQQRTQVNGALGQMRQLPADQQRQVSSAFRSLRALPPDQRTQAMEQYKGQLNPQQQQTLTNLMHAEPYLPLQR